MLAFLLFVAPGTSAQTTSTITGEVRDTNGALLVGVRITAKEVETGNTRTTLSEGEGRFVFPGLPVGIYELRGELAGFDPLVRPNVNLTVNDTVDVLLVLKVSGMSEQVTVESGEASVNTQPPS